MKNKIVFIVGVLFAANVVYSEYQYCPVSNKDSGYVHNGQLMPKCTENDSPEIWSGSWEDLKAISVLVCGKFPFELTKHLGRDIAALKPATLEEMKLGKEKGYLNNWEEYSWDLYHEPSNIIDDWVKISPGGEGVGIVNDIVKLIGGKVFKYTTHSGDEVVYDKKDGKIILDEKLGTRNLGDNYKWLGMVIEEVTEEIKRKGVLPSWFPSEMIGRIVQLCFEYPSHREVDIVPHEKNNQYKYAGILFESDSDGRFYIVDGQTGKRMTKKQVEDFPTTFSDMWKDKGLVCVESDAIDIVPPKENRQSAQNASSKDGNFGVNGHAVDLSQFDQYVQEIILAYKEFNSTLEECVELSETPINISGANTQVTGLRGIVARGNAIEAEKKTRWRKWQIKYEKSIRKLNDKTLALENALQSLKDKDISSDKIIKIRKMLCRPILPYIRKTLEIAKRADSDIADSIIKQFSALEKFISDDNTKFEY